MFDAVIFDCDGVLVDSEILSLEAELDLLADHGLALEAADYQRRFMGMHHALFFDALRDHARDDHGVELPADFRAQLYDRYAVMEDRIEAVDGAAAAVAALTGPKAVASSSGAESLRRKLENTGLAGAFDPHIYSADLVARGKPHPDIFLLAAERLGVQPGRCLVIEDSLNGVFAGLAAGMTVWGFSGGLHMDEAAGARLLEAGAHRLIRRWDEATAFWTGLERIDRGAPAA